MADKKITTCPVCAFTSVEVLLISSPTKDYWFCVGCGHVWTTANQAEQASIDRRAIPKPRDLPLHANRAALVSPIVRRERPIAEEFKHLTRATLSLQLRMLNLIRAPFRLRDHLSLRREIRAHRHQVHRYRERRAEWLAQGPA